MAEHMERLTKKLLDKVFKEKKPRGEPREKSTKVKLYAPQLPVDISKASSRNDLSLGYCYLILG